MEEIDVFRLLKFYKEKMLILIFITLCVAICFFTYDAIFKKPMYQSYTTVILGGNENNNNSTSLTQSDVLLNKNLVDTYTEVVKSKRVLEQVISYLQLDMTYGQLVKKIVVTSANNTEIIKIIVNFENPNDAQKIADSIANYFTKEVRELYKLENVNVLDKASINVKPYNINYKKTVVIAIGIGFVVAVAFVFCLFYFDRTIKSVEMVEEITGLPILGTIQESKRKGKNKR